jgi:hypothetical protein
MGYVPYTASKDYFEEPNTGGDLILVFDSTSGSLAISCIEETALATLGMAPPSSKIGVTYGKFLDVVKIYVNASQYTGDTSSLFSDRNSPFFNMMETQVLNRFKSLIGAAQAGGSSDFIAGKILRVDYLPESTGKFAGAIVTVLFYMQ